MNLIRTLERVDRFVYALLDEYGRLIALLVALLIGLVSFLSFADSIINTPHVYFQYPSGECLRVDAPDASLNCENLPERFVHHWVMYSE